MEIHIKIVKHLLKCYFKHIFIILCCFKMCQTYRFNHHSTYSYSGRGSIKRALSYYYFNTGGDEMHVNFSSLPIMQNGNLILIKRIINPNVTDRYFLLTCNNINNNKNNKKNNNYKNYCSWT